MFNRPKKNVSELVKVDALKNYMQCGSFSVVGLQILSICFDSGNEIAALSSNSTLNPGEKACQN